jgi:hypoxanthine phosphoribosyltransferase
MNKIYYTERTVKTWVHNIVRAMNHDGFKPDYIVGLTRGGLVPAVMLSHYLDVPMHSLGVSLRDNTGFGPESNCWMAEDAYGYKSLDEQDPKNILIVDDINDSGATLNWIREDWQSGCIPNDTDRWNTIWGNTTRFAVMVNNEASDFKDVNYVGQSINKLEEPIWCVFPWEEWWR